MQARSCRWNGTRVDWQGRVVRLDPGSTKNREGRSFPFTTVLERLLKDQLSEHERLKRLGQIMALVCHRSGERIRDFPCARKAVWTAAGVLGGFCMTSDGRLRNLEHDGVSPSTAMAMGGHKTEST